MDKSIDKVVIYFFFSEMKSMLLMVSRGLEPLESVLRILVDSNKSDVYDRYCSWKCTWL